MKTTTNTPLTEEQILGALVLFEENPTADRVGEITTRLRMAGITTESGARAISKAIDSARRALDGGDAEPTVEMEGEVRNAMREVVKAAADDFRRLSSTLAPNSERTALIQRGIDGDLDALDSLRRAIGRYAERATGVGKSEAERALKRFDSEELPSDPKIQALGVATITSVGSENVYIAKDGRQYFFKPGNNDGYEVGLHDFASEPSPYDGAKRRPAAQRDYLFLLEGVEREMWSVGASEDDARTKLMNGLDSNQRRVVVSIACVDVRPVEAKPAPTELRTPAQDVAWDPSAFQGYTDSELGLIRKGFMHALDLAAAAERAAGVSSAEVSPDM